MDGIFEKEVSSRAFRSQYVCQVSGAKIVVIFGQEQKALARIKTFPTIRVVLCGGLCD